MEYWFEVELKIIFSFFFYRCLSAHYTHTFYQVIFIQNVADIVKYI